MDTTPVTMLLKEGYNYLFHIHDKLLIMGTYYSTFQMFLSISTQM